MTLCICVYCCHLLHLLYLRYAKKRLPKGLTHLSLLISAAVASGDDNEIMTIEKKSRWRQLINCDSNGTDSYDNNNYR